MEIKYFKGTAYNVGLQYGKCYNEQLYKILKFIKNKLINEKNIKMIYEQIVEGYLQYSKKETFQILKGISEQTNIDFNDLILIDMIENIYVACIAHSDLGCSYITVEKYSAKNHDWDSSFFEIADCVQIASFEIEEMPQKYFTVGFVGCISAPIVCLNENYIFSSINSSLPIDIMHNITYKKINVDKMPVNVYFFDVIKNSCDLQQVTQKYSDYNSFISVVVQCKDLKLNKNLSVEIFSDKLKEIDLMNNKKIKLKKNVILKEGDLSYSNFLYGFIKDYNGYYNLSNLECMDLIKHDGQRNQNNQRFKTIEEQIKVFKSTLDNRSSFENNIQFINILKKLDLKKNENTFMETFIKFISCGDEIVTIGIRDINYQYQFKYICIPYYKIFQNQM